MWIERSRYIWGMLWDRIYATWYWLEWKGGAYNNSQISGSDDWKNKHTTHPDPEYRSSKFWDGREGEMRSCIWIMLIMTMRYWWFGDKFVIHRATATSPQFLSLHTLAVEDTALYITLISSWFDAHTVFCRRALQPQRVLPLPGSLDGPTMTTPLFQLTASRCCGIQ